MSDDEKNRRKRKSQNLENKPNKKSRNSNPDSPIIVHYNYSDNDKNEIEEEPIKKEACNNPLCDHKDFDDDDIERYLYLESPIEIESINDLIELGKTYHCKKRKEYFGVSLKILFNLVVPLTKLKNMIGMDSVKENIINQIIFYLQSLEDNERCNICINCMCGKLCKNIKVDDMMHTIITGPPGVGKTELGKILGEIYKAMGVLKNGKLHIATRSDLHDV